jgi:PAS domain S-box-containing protein
MNRSAFVSWNTFPAGSWRSVPLRFPRHRAEVVIPAALRNHWCITAAARGSGGLDGFGDIAEAVAQLALPVFALERDGTIRWLNRAAQRVIGDRTGEHFSKIVAPESLPIVEREFAKKIVGTTTSSEYEANLLRPDGSRVTVEVSSVPLKGEGRIVGIFGIARVEDESRRPALPTEHPLTPRQAEVLELLARGCSTAQIAERLGVAHETARNHIRATLRRLGAHTRLEAVVVAQREGLI